MEYAAAIRVPAASGFEPREEMRTRNVRSVTDGGVAGVCLGTHQRREQSSPKFDVIFHRVIPTNALGTSGGCATGGFSGGRGLAATFACAPW